MKKRKFKSDAYIMTARTDKLTDGMLAYILFCKGIGGLRSKLNVQLCRIIRFTIMLD
jgi:hypothetical protein